MRRLNQTNHTKLQRLCLELCVGELKIRAVIAWAMLGCGQQSWELGDRLQRKRSL